MVAPVLLKGLRQAVRNCPWVVEFWMILVRAQERLKEQHDNIVGECNFCRNLKMLEILPFQP